MRVLDLGIEDYQATLTRQREIRDALASNPSAEEALILVEHPAVYTFGRSQQSEIPAAIGGIPCVAIERGGKTTFHNPGQLVAYPILRLQAHERDVLKYIRRLELWIARSLAHWGLEASGNPKLGASGTGIWVGEGTRKIASLGVALSRWITLHGIALNVHNDLSGFSAISPCGMNANIMTSLLKETGTAYPIPEIKAVLVQEFCLVFERTLTSFRPTDGIRENYPSPSFPMASTGQASIASSHCSSSADVEG